MLFNFIRLNDLKITRLDVAFDDHSGLLNIRQILEDTQSGMYISKSDYWETVLSSKGSTVQIGSPQSKVLIRIYNKAAERGYTSDVHWVRVEIQLRDDRAVQFTKIPLSIGQAFSGVLLNYLRYIEPSEDVNKWRWPMTAYWSALVEDAERISIYQTPGMLKFFFSLLTDAVLGVFKSFFDAFKDSSLFDFFKQPPIVGSDGTQTDGGYGLPSEVGTGFAFISGVIMVLPPDLRSILFFSLAAMVLFGVLKLVKA